MNGSKMFPPAYLLIAIVVMIILHFIFPLTMIVFPPWKLLGIIPLVGGVILNIVADNTFQRVNTTVKPFEESTALVTSGIYQVSRNPMYLGFVLILTGIATLLGSLTPFGVIPVFIILMEKNFIQFEEQGLAQKFGSRWVAYRRQVRRWV